MQRNKRDIGIKNPCSLEWNSLEGKGCTRFCRSCSTSVIDLTEKSDSEIIDFVMRQKGKVCARIKQEQVDRVIEKNRANASIIKAFVAFTLGFATFTQGNAATEKTVPHVYEQINSGQPRLSADTSKKFLSVKDSILTFSGKVVDSDGNSELPGVNVFLKGTKIGTQTDIDGRFSLEVPTDILGGQNPVLIFSFVGYTTSELELHPSTRKNIKITLTPDIVWLGEIYIPWYKRLWWTITSPFRKD